MKKVWIISALALVLAGCTATASYQPPNQVEYTVSGEITDQAEAEAAVAVVKANLQYATEEDMEGYLSTLISSAREETAEELHSVLEEYDLEHTILDVEVLEQQPERMLLRTEQQTVMTGSVENAKPYRSHVAEANHTLVKEEGSWKIEETIMTDTTFIK